MESASLQRTAEKPTNVMDGLDEECRRLRDRLEAISDQLRAVGDELLGAAPHPVECAEKQAEKSGRIDRIVSVIDAGHQYASEIQEQVNRLNRQLT